MSKQSQSSAILTAFLSIAMIVGCANERPNKPVIGDDLRVAKTAFQGKTYLYLKSIADVEYPGDKYNWAPPGYYLDHDRLVQFEIKKHSLEIVAIDPQYQTARVAKRNAVLASFPVEHVDVLPKENEDGDPTHEEEVTDSRRVWSERAFLKIAAAEDQLSPFKKDTVIGSTPGGIQIDPATGAINFIVARHMDDDTIVKVRYSLVPYEHNENYEQREYPKELQTKFGFFPTTTYKINKYGRMVNADKKEFINRWDTSKPVVYYLSENFPEHLVPTVKTVFANWNKAFKNATGHNVLEVRENTGQQTGDIRYSMITYVDKEASSHGILGYGPSYTNPRTGEIVKADVLLYGGALRSSLFGDRIWEQLLQEQEKVSARGTFGQRAPRRDGMAPPHKLGGNDLLASFFGGLTPSFDQVPTSGRLIDSVVMDELNSLTVADAIARVRKEVHEDLGRQIFRVNEEMLLEINQAKHLHELSDNDLQIKVFNPLLTHELGHTFGLRHNFQGSADERHFAPNSKTSTVMDYGYLTSHESQDVGPYDRAAIAVSYGPGTEAAIAPHVAENYYFCTDQNTLDSRNALCNHFDAGTSLTEVVAAWTNRYLASYVFNNMRLDRVHFGQGRTSSGSYVNRVMRYVVPIRMAFDNANAITRAFREAASSGDLTQLWYVARQRIEADPSSEPDNIVEIEVAAGLHTNIKPGTIEFGNTTVKRRLDVTKIPAVVMDARQAETQAFLSLAQVVMEDNRPLFDSADFVHDELQIRGVILDKLLSVLFVGSRTSDPLATGQSISMFAALESGAAEAFIQSLISNTQPTRNQTTGEVYQALKFHDINLRQMALNLLVNELAVPGSGAEARELLIMEQIQADSQDIAQKANLMLASHAATLVRPQIEQDKEKLIGQVASHVSMSLGSQLIPGLGSLLSIPFQLMAADAQADLEQVNQMLERMDQMEAHLNGLIAKTQNRDEKEIEAILAIRVKIRAIYAQLFMGTLDRPAQIQALAAIATLEEEREKINSAYMPVVGDRFFKSPVKLEMYNFQTASGHLIRDNVNRMEDRLGGISIVARGLAAQMAALLALPPDQRDPAVMRQLSGQIDQVTRTSDAMKSYLGSEKLFAKKIYRAYDEPEI